MSASQPPSNPLDEIKSGITESPPHEEFKAGLADKQPLLQNNQPRYAFGWFDKWLLIIPVILFLLLCYLGWTALNPATTAPNASTSPTTSAALTAPTTSGASNAPNAAASISLNAPSGGTTVAVGETITLSGQAPPGSEVQLLNRGKPISTTTADANGNYEFNLSAAQPGVYELQTITTINGQQVTSPPVTITVTGQAANATSVASGNTPGAGATSQANATSDANAAGGANATVPANVTMDTNATGGANATVPANATTDANATGSANATVPANATTDANATPNANVTSAAPVVSLQTATSPVTAVLGQAIQLVGVAPPGATVELYNYASLIATTTADANGAFRFDVTPTTAGEYSLQAVTTVNGQQVSSAPVVFVVPEAGTGGTTGAASTPGATELPTNVANGAATPSAESTPGSANGGNIGGSGVNPPTVNLGAAGLLTFGALLTGTAPPNSHVVIYLNDKEIGSADADANGAWQFLLPETIAPGEYEITVVVTDASGKPIGTASEKQTVHIVAKPLLPVTGGEFQ